MYSTETRVALVKERARAKERQRQIRVYAAALVLAALPPGSLWGAALRSTKNQGGDDMIRKRLLSACLALALCLSLLPVTALAADGGTVYVGGVKLSGSTDSPAYATTDDNGTVTIVDASADKYNIKWDGSTLTLDGAKIKGGTSSESLYATVGIYAFSNSGDVSLNIALKGVNEIFESSNGIWVYSSSDNAGAVTLTIEGEGSLNASGSSSGILVQSKQRRCHPDYPERRCHS